jgi:SecD/SecF fusion protein
MLRLLKKPAVNWMALRPVFLTISTLLIAAGLFVFFTRDDVKNNKYDIEFTGGTSVQINLKDNVSLSREQVESKIYRIGTELENPALAAANVYKIGDTDKQYEINTTETNKTTVTVTFPQAEQKTVAELISAIEKTQGKFSGRLSNLLVTQAGNPASFVITTSQANKSLVKELLSTALPDADISEPQVREVVNNAILNAFAGDLQIQQNLQPKIISNEKISETLIDSYPELTDFLGGIKIICEIQKASTAEEITQRFRDLRFKPDMQNVDWYFYKILGPDLNAMQQNQPVNTFAYLSVEPEAGFRELTEDQWQRFVENETTKVLAAAELETSLPRVTQIDPSVGAESKTRALIAIVLSLFAIVTYIWIRFGNVRYGLAAITALVHDVCITLGAVTACTYIAATPIGEKLLIGDFKINLAIIAAFLTLIGYSLNDTIVVFDRIRENRRKARLVPQTISNSINQTLSRTILTSFTTFIVVLIMYIFGGQGLRGLTFAIGFGIIIGTYSSVAIAAPVLLLGTRAGNKKSKQPVKR